eukprot:TRINITY_DN10493_c0_g4_i1.p2 TRINITY_DN10493_c0_g4~~TRINITY_DN10493_c0_g4_i1.p2  ORF type:complete len:238 (+),score=68.68 TRINITY_DN10493_c0_g4_i1:136-849(+)
MSLAFGVTLPAAASQQAGQGQDSRSKRMRPATDEQDEEAEGLSDTMMRKLTIYNAKLSLAGAQANRQTKAQLTDQFLLPADHFLITEITKNTKSWNDAAKAIEPARRMDEIGYPYHHAWNALLQNLYIMEGITQKEKTALEKYAEANANLQKQHPEVYKNAYWTFEHQVRLCRVCKTHDKTKKRLEVGVHGGTPASEMWPFIANLLGRSKNISRRNGMAPPSEMENQVQAILDKLKH